MPAPIGKVYQYTLDGQFVAEYECIAEAAQLNNVSPTKINSCVNNKVYQAHKFYWSYKYYIKLPKELIDIIHSNICRTRVYQYDLNGNFIQMWNSVTDVTKDLKLPHGHIGNCLNAIRGKTCKGFLYRTDYYDKLPLEILEQHINIKFKKILQYDLDGKFIKEWNSIRDAKKALKITGISGCITGIKKTAGGFIWKYKE